MLKSLFALLLLFFCALAQANWSRFAYVSPETEKNYELKVYVAPTDKNNETFIVRFEAVSYPFKQAWVITTPKPISAEAQNQRYRFWGEELDVSGLEALIPLRPKGIPMFPPQGEDKTKKIYEVFVPANEIERTYIYIDFPSTVDDGGYFYSVDIGSYVKQRK